ncbi:MAG: hypothetical protein Q9219_002573 [cf. Caloplaca sp. 3 TL-2023]
MFLKRLVRCLVHSLPFLCTRASVPSPQASIQLICHTDHGAGCYPKIFQPTEEFQSVHDDQQLPPGLHVRINIATGLKEARLNVPEPRGTVTTFSDLAIIDNSDLLGYEAEPLEHPTDRHEDANTQKPMRVPSHDVGESVIFSESADVVKRHDPVDTSQLIAALTDLEDLSHSYQWGVTLAKDVDLSHRLFLLLLPSQRSLEIRSLAALVFGTAVGNNPAALGIALSHFYNDEWPEGPLEAVILALVHDQAPKLLNGMMFLLSALCQDKDQLERFLEADGIAILIEIYQGNTTLEKDSYRINKKVAHFVVDYLRRPMSEDVAGSEPRILESKETESDSEWVNAQLRSFAQKNHSSAEE